MVCWCVVTIQFRVKSESWLVARLSVGWEQKKNKAPLCKFMDRIIGCNYFGAVIFVSGIIMTVLDLV